MPQTAFQSNAFQSNAFQIGNGTTASFYFEMRLAALNATGSNLRMGVDLFSDSYTTAASTASNGTLVDQTGAIWSLGSSTNNTIGTLQQGDVIGVAVDTTNFQAWFRKLPGGFWNGSISADPHMNIGGVSVSSGGVEPIITFGGTGGSSNNAWSINTNARLFCGPMPLGFTAYSGY